jgi:hypothetical protein
MTLKKYLLSFSVIVLLTWGIFIFLAMMINPETSNWLSFALFYFSLFLSLGGTINIFGLLLRRRLLKNSLNFHLAKSSFRQSFLFSFLLVSILFMLAENLFSWLNILILIIILSIIEYVLISDSK